MTGAQADHESLGQVCFVSDFRYLERCFTDLAPFLLDRRAAWLHKLDADAALREAPAAAGEGARSAVVRVGPGRHKPRVPVVVTAGVAHPRTGAVHVPLRWAPLSHTRMLPELDGDLELSRVDPTTSRIGLLGRYDAPMGALGRGLDRVALHGVAESSVRDFLHRVELALVESSGGAPGRRSRVTEPGGAG